MGGHQEIAIPIHPDEDGFIGRECPECLGYFKIQPGTGLKGEGLPCHCPYCGHIQSQDHFWTKEQLEYAKSIALNKFTGELFKNMKKLERKPDRGSFLSVEIKVEGHPYPIRYYREKQLEEDIICDSCTLHYAIYGVFGFCPDCGIHNSYQILNANLQRIEKMLVFSNTCENDIALKLIEHALQDAVAGFDGFGREICKAYSEKASDPPKAIILSFQNIEGVKDKLLTLFNIDITTIFNPEEWHKIIVMFQKRHLLVHRMGVIDQKYIDATGGALFTMGKKISVRKDEVVEFLAYLRKLGAYLKHELEGDVSCLEF